jgi:hypothetical protein
VQQTSENQPVESSNGVSRTSFIVLLLLTIGLAAFSAYTLLKTDKKTTDQTTATTTGTTTNTTDTTSSSLQNLPDEQQLAEQKQQQELARQRRMDSLREVQRVKALAKQAADSGTKAAAEDDATDPNPNPATTKPLAQYMVINKAYFYNSPDQGARRNAFVVPSNNAILNAFDEQNDFIYVVFTNTAGQTSKGWLKKQDLQKLEE